MAVLAHLLAIMIGTAPIAAAASDEAAPPPHTYLHPPADGCDSRVASDEVVVCGSKELNEQYRLRPNDDDTRFAERPVRAEMTIGNAKLALAADARKIGDAQDDVYFRRRHSDVRLRFTLPF